MQETPAPESEKAALPGRPQREAHIDDVSLDNTLSAHQAQRLARRFALPLAVAATVAGLCYVGADR
jgi:hypothetical protein